MVEVFSL